MYRPLLFYVKSFQFDDTPFVQSHVFSPTAQQPAHYVIAATTITGEEPVASAPSPPVLSSTSGRTLPLPVPSENRTATECKFFVLVLEVVFIRKIKRFLIFFVRL
jgi:hypothetical protein